MMVSRQHADAYPLVPGIQQCNCCYCHHDHDHTPACNACHDVNVLYGLILHHYIVGALAAACNTFVAYHGIASG